MAGKAYTMKELKSIVDHLKENQLYADVKGRKIWRDYEKSTNRTWQSLKETFLRRILPEIHNPYFKLSSDEIASFQAGRYIGRSNNNLKLKESGKINHLPDKPQLSANTDQQKKNEHLNIKTQENSDAGEVLKSSKIDLTRDSVETVILDTENYYANAQEIKNDLLSVSDEDNMDEEYVKSCLLMTIAEDDNNFESNPPTSSKKLRDFITYEEPLTPMLQEMLHNNFDSEASVSGDEGAVNGENNTNKENEASEDILTPNSVPNNIKKSPANKKLLSLRNNKMKEKETDKTIIKNASDRDVLNAKGSKEKYVNNLLDNDTNSRVTRSNKNVNIDKEPVNGENSKSVSLTVDKNIGATAVPEALENVDTVKNPEFSTDSTILNNQAVKVKQGKKAIFGKKLKKTKNNLKKKNIKDSTNNSESIDNQFKTGNGSDIQVIDSNHTQEKEKADEGNKKNKPTEVENVSANNDEGNENNKLTEVDTVSANNDDDGNKNIKLTGVDKDPANKSENKNDLANSQNSEVLLINSYNTEEKASEAIENSAVTEMDRVPASNSESLIDPVINRNGSEAHVINSNNIEEKPGNSNGNYAATDVAKVTSLQHGNDVNTAECIKDASHNNADKITSNTAECSNDIPLISNADKVTSNPCLQNVNLYSEQLTPNINSNDGNVVNDVIVVRSNSPSHSEDSSAGKIIKSKSKNPNRLKHSDVLSKLFGYSNAPHTKRLSQQQRSHLGITRDTIVSESSEMSTDSDFVTRPRNHITRPRKYLQHRMYEPGTYLDEEAELYVTEDNKIYPVIKNGKKLMGCLGCKALIEALEEQESYWKKKYYKERKRKVELMRLFEEMEDDAQAEMKRRKLSASHRNESDNSDAAIASCSKFARREKPVPGLHRGTSMIKTESAPELPKAEKLVKFKFVQDKQEVMLEGELGSIQPMMTEVLKIFNRDKPEEVKNCITNAPQTSAADSSNTVTDNKQATPPSITVTPPSITMTPPSITMTPPTPALPHNHADTVTTVEIPEVTDVSERINKLEEEIFQEILELAEKTSDKESDDREAPAETDNHVTVRKRGRPKKTKEKGSSDIANKKDSDNEIIVNEKRLRLVSCNTRETRTKRSKTSVENSNSGETDGEPPKTGEESVKADEAIDLTGEHESTVQSPALFDDESEAIRYKFPETNEKETEETDNVVNSSQKENVAKAITPSPIKKTKLNEDKYCMNLEFNNGSQMFEQSNENEQIAATTSHSQTHSTFSHSSSINSNIYRTESYQLLMQHQNTCHDNIQSKNNIFLVNVNLSPASQTLDKENTVTTKLKDVDSSYESNANIGNSSNISLPASPEISIVEKISISQEMLEDIPLCINDEFDDIRSCNDDVQNVSIVSKRIDAGIPLMDQELQIVRAHKDVQETVYDVTMRTMKTPKSENKNYPPKTPLNTPVSESLINKINSVIINEPTVSDTLNDKLCNMLLDSAQKPSALEKENVREKVSKTRQKKKSNRSSTPNKKVKNTKSKVVSKDMEVLEECMEYARRARGSRKSCPPSIMCALADDSQGSNSRLGNSEVSQDNTKELKRKRKKTAVIKVKILRPKHFNVNRIKPRSQQEKQTADDFDITDSESGIFLNVNDTVDLIHNHSETCLHTHECLDEESVVFVDASKSVITIDSNSLQPANCTVDNVTLEKKIIQKESLDCFSSDAQDATSVSSRTGSSYRRSSNPSTIVPTSHTSAANVTLNSLMTEDLSDENDKPRSSWHLLSEDETNTNNLLSDDELEIKKRQNDIVNSQYMKQLFPITCAVPDLSTITEWSRDADSNSRKHTYSGNM